MNTKSNPTEVQSTQLVQGERTLSVVDLIENIAYFRWHFIFTFLFISAASVLYAVIATPIYVADALIQVEEKKGTSLGALTQVAAALGAQQAPILGEIEIIRSRSVIGRAIEGLQANIEVSVDNRLPVIGAWLARILPKGSDGLAVPPWRWERFAWGGESLKISHVSVPPSLEGAPMFLVTNLDKSWDLLSKDGQLLMKGSGDGNVYSALDGELLLGVNLIRAKPGTKFRITVYSLQSRINQVLSNLNVGEAKRQSNILKITYQSPSPERAANMLNAISDAYLKQNITRRSEEAELSLEFLNTELPKLRTKLDASERALNDFRSKTKTIDISSEIKELLFRATAIEKNQLELDMKRREFQVRYDISHPLMRSLLSQIEGLQIESNTLTNKIGALPIVQQDYIRLARNVEVNNQLYVGLLNNYQQLQIAKAGTTGNVAIIDRAISPEKPSKPKKALSVAVGAFLGLLVGFGICQILSLITRIVRDPKKLEAETGLPTLAVLPLDSDQIAESDKVQSEIFLLAKERPNSTSIESLRSLRTSLLFKLSEKAGSKVILITSAVPSQGKSFISVNLSFLFSAMGKKVLLIEADIRMASMKRYLPIEKTAKGLSGALQGKISARDVIQKNIFPNMDFMPSGPTVRNPGDLLATESMTHLISAVQNDYDLIIIDSPPLLPVHDARSLGGAADISLFVARQDAVSMAEVNEAIDLFEKSGNKFDGVVFNGFVPSTLRYGYGYGTGYNYFKYGGKSKYGSKYSRNYGTYGNPEA